MTGKPRTPAYIAVARQTFDHPIFIKHPEWLPPWLWLIAKAAYKPCAHRLGLGIVDVQRGQLATTLRRLAGAWGWPVGNVQYMLRLFQGQGMLTKLTIHTSFHTGSESRKSHRATLITICNYNKFQAAARSKVQANGAGFIDDLSQDLSQDGEFLPGIVAEVVRQQEQPTQNHIEIERGGRQDLHPVNFGDNSSTTQWKDKPPHGAKDRKTGKWQWFDHPSSEWAQAARLYAADKGARIFPKMYKGGRGNWFKVRSPAEIKLLYQRICEIEGIPKVTLSPGPRLLSRK